MFEDKTAPGSSLRFSVDKPLAEAVPLPGDAVMTLRGLAELAAWEQGNGFVSQGDKLRIALPAKPANRCGEGGELIPQRWLISQRPFLEGAPHGRSECFGEAGFGSPREDRLCVPVRHDLGHGFVEEAPEPGLVMGAALLAGRRIVEAGMGGDDDRLAPEFGSGQEGVERQTSPHGIA